MNTQTRRCNEIARCCALSCTIVLVAVGVCGCMGDGRGDGSSPPLAGFLGATGTASPTISDNNSDEPTFPNSDATDATDSTENSSAEAKVLGLINTHRSQGADCGSKGMFASATPLASNELLATIAQNHSTDMSTRGYFDHTSPDGVGPGDRIDASGYQWSTWGENIAVGQRTPEEVVESWMGSDGHCSNIMNPAFTEIGIGYEAEGSYWTQVFGAPR